MNNETLSIPKEFKEQMKSLTSCFMLRTRIFRDFKLLSCLFLNKF